MKKLLAGILLLIILFSTISFYPRKARAIPVEDWAALAQAAGAWAGTIAEYAKEAGEIALNIATSAFRKMILDMIVDEIIAWISGEGTSAFDTGDWGQFFDEAAQQAGGLALEEITGPGVMAQLCDADWAGQVRFSLQSPKKFAQKARCTLRDIGVNYDNFIENFENGGWAAWIKISEGPSNPYNYFLSAVDEKLAKETQKKLGLEKELTASGGFVSDKVCVLETCEMLIINNSCSEGYELDETSLGCKKTIYHNSKDNIKDDEIAGNCKCKKWETRTPGKIMADSLSKTTFRDVDWLQENSEWYNYVVAIGNAVVNRLTKEGVKAIKSAVRPGSPTSVSTGITSQADFTAPLTSAKIIDPWRVKLTANEPAKTYYSLDGSNPSTYRSLEYKGASLTVINSTASNAPTAQLKWMSIDDNYNKEASRGLPAFLRAPFDYSTLTAYIASQDTSIPDEIKTALIKFFRDEENGKEAAKISKETSIPADLRLNLKNYLKIEDLRIQTGRTSMLSAEQRDRLDVILATYDDFNPANDGKLTDLINILTAIKNSGTDAFADIQTSAEEIKNRRNNLQSVLSYFNGLISGLENCSKKRNEAAIKEEETKEEFAVRTAIEFAKCQANAQAGAFPINLNGLSSALATDPLFSELKDKTDKVILERSLIAVDPAGNWTEPAAAIAPADSNHVAILSASPSTGKPTASFFKQISWETDAARGIAFGSASGNQINGFYYKQAFSVPAEEAGTAIWYGAIDTTGNTNWNNEKNVEFGAPLQNLPPITDFVKPIAEIKSPNKDNDGYFILDPSQSIDNDITPSISGYEWNFINETSATATPRYDFEIFDVNRDNVFETTQCLYKPIYESNHENAPLKGLAYYDAAYSSPYNNAPNVRPLNLDLPKTCEKIRETTKTTYYWEKYNASTKEIIETKEINQTKHNEYKNDINPSSETENKFNCATVGNTCEKIYTVGNLLTTGAYEDMKIVDPNNGIIKVKFAAGGGPITIGLRVTDDEGLTAVKSVVINP